MMGPDKQPGAGAPRARSRTSSSSVANRGGASAPSGAPAAQRPSSIRHVVGVVCLLASLVVVAVGFAMMIGALEAGQYGTPHITWALAALGAGGGLMGVGFALLIWEYSVRHGVRH